MTKLSKEDNDRLQAALMRDRLAGIRMERGDIAGALEALRDAPEPAPASILPSNLDAATPDRGNCLRTEECNK